MARTYVITGAGSGIGKATASRLRKDGHKVIGLDLKGADIKVDLSTFEGREEAAKLATKKAKGKVDAVIACAGLALPSPKTVSVNYFGMTEFLNAMQPALAKSKSPRAVVVSSMASLQQVDEELVARMCIDDNEQEALARAQTLVEIGGGIENMIYGSTKRAVSRWVRRECIKPAWAGAGIPLNAVGPGIVKTPMVAQMIATEESRKYLDEVVPMPLNYYMKPSQVASLLIWLTSKENTHVTGQTIYIDGGSDAVLRGDNVWDLRN